MWLCMCCRAMGAMSKCAKRVCVGVWLGYCVNVECVCVCACARVALLFRANVCFQVKQCGCTVSLCDCPCMRVYASVTVSLADGLVLLCVGEHTSRH